MKQTLLLLFLFITSFSFGQIEFDHDVYSSIFDATKDYDVKTSLYITNTTDVDADFIWKIEQQSGPEEWTVYFCDLVKCHLPGVLFVDNSITNTLTADSTKVLEFHVQPGGIVGVGAYKLTLLDPNDDTNIIAEAIIELGETTVGNEDIEINNLSVYPNPVQSYFSIDGSSDLFREVAIFNILGKEIKSFSKSYNNEYYVGDLLNGRYFVRLIDNNGQSVQVLRLLKQGI